MAERKKEQLREQMKAIEKERQKGPLPSFPQILLFQVFKPYKIFQRPFTIIYNDNNKSPLLDDSYILNQYFICLG